MNNTKFLFFQIRNGLYCNSPLITYRNFSTAPESEGLIKIDKGLWKVFIFAFNNIDNGIHELINNFNPDKNYVLLVQGSYHNQFISIGPKVFVNKETSPEFTEKPLSGCWSLLASQNYDVEAIEDIIFRFRDVEVVKITQPTLPTNNNFKIKPIIPKSFLFEKYSPASVLNENFGELISNSVDSDGREVSEFEYNKFTIIRTKVSDSQYFNEVLLNGKSFTTF